LGGLRLEGRSSVLEEPLSATVERPLAEGQFIAELEIGSWFNKWRRRTATLLVGCVVLFCLFTRNFLS